MSRIVTIPKQGWTAVRFILVALAAWIVAGIASGFVADQIDTITTDYAGSKALALTNHNESIQRDRALIIRRNLFDAASRSESAAYDSTSAPGIPVEGDFVGAKKTTLPLTLIGTLISPDGVTRLAAVEITDDKDFTVFHEETTFRGATVVKIERNRVYFMRGGEVEYLATDFSGWKSGDNTADPEMASRKAGPGGDVAKIGEGNYVVDKRYLDAQLTNMANLITQVRAVPNIGPDGKANGFKLFSIVKGSIFEKIGFENRDVIKRVNGVEIDSVQKGMELFDAFRHETNFSVDVERENQKQTLTFAVQ